MLSAVGWRDGDVGRVKGRQKMQLKAPGRVTGTRGWAGVGRLHTFQGAKETWGASRLPVVLSLASAGGALGWSLVATPLS